MKRFVLSLIFLAVYAYADVPFLGCTSANTNSGMSVGASVANALYIGCLSVGDTSTGPPPSNNDSSNGLYINPTNTSVTPTFQTDGLYVAYSVSYEGGGEYQYTYTFDEAASTPLSDDLISHVIIGVGSSCAGAGATGSQITTGTPCIYNLAAYTIPETSPNVVAGVPLTLLTGALETEIFSSAGLAGETSLGGNPMIPWNTAALQVLPNESNQIGPPRKYPNGYTIQFDSNEAPAWENVYVRDGTVNSLTNEAWNNGSIGGLNGSAGFFVAAPGIVAPEASFYVLFAALMAGLLFYRRISRKRSLAL